MVLLRQRTDSLAQQQHLLGQEGPFPGLGLKQAAFQTDKIADVQLTKQGVFRFAEQVPAEVGLKQAGPVPQPDKRGLAEAVDRHQTAGNGKNGGVLRQRFGFLVDQGPNIADGMAGRKIVRIQRDLLGPELIDLLSPFIEHIAFFFRFHAIPAPGAAAAVAAAVSPRL